MLSNLSHIDQIIVSAMALIAVAIVSYVLLRGWSDWIALKRAELDRQNPQNALDAPLGRIEVADLKERVRKLEAIAAGVDL